MIFEFDPNKSMSNKTKHGIDFIEAQEIWDDQNNLTIQASTHEEFRWAKIGKIKSNIWTCIFTKRGANIRLISARRAQQKEIKIYEKK